MTDDIPPDRLDRILAATETIEESVGILVEKRQGLDRATYRSRTDLQDIVERRFVKLTEAAIDIGTTLVVSEAGQPPSSNPATMRELQQLGILTESTADAMVESARFRNVLSHTYGNAIDHDIVYDALFDLERYRTFLSEVQTYLDERGALDG